MYSRIRHSLAVALVAGGLACGDATSPVETPTPVASVTIAPISGVVWAGNVRQLEATPRAADGTPLSDRAVVWSSDDEDVVVIDQTGRLEGRAAGSTVVTAISEGKQAEITITVAEADLIYEGYPTGLAEMVVLSLRGGEPQRILPPHTVIGSPVPSPDGSRIAFVIADYVEFHGEIFVVNRDGTGLQQLTFADGMDDQPSWSPDGTRIAFRSFRAQRLGDIWVMNADGTNPVLLTPDPLPGVTDEMRPAWSPDGSRIAYAGNSTGTLNIWTMRPDGSDKRQITNTGDYNTEPTWSPDGHRIAFRRGTLQDGTDIMTIPAAGGEPTLLARDGTDILPSWSPDGRLIAFTHLPASGGSPQIYTMRPDGTDVTLRTVEYWWNGGRGAQWIRRTW